MCLDYKGYHLQLGLVRQVDRRSWSGDCLFNRIFNNSRVSLVFCFSVSSFCLFSLSAIARLLMGQEAASVLWLLLSGGQFRQRLMVEVHW